MDAEVRGFNNKFTTISADLQYQGIPKSQLLYGQLCQQDELLVHTFMKIKEEILLK